MKRPPSQSSHVLHRLPQEPNEKRNPSIKTNLGRFDSLVARHYPAVYNFASGLIDDLREAVFLTYRRSITIRSQLWLLADGFALVEFLLRPEVRPVVRSLALNSW